MVRIYLNISLNNPDCLLNDLVLVYSLLFYISVLIFLEIILVSIRKPNMTQRFILFLSTLTLPENCTLLVRKATYFNVLKRQRKHKGSSVNSWQSISMVFVQNDQNGMAVLLHMHYVRLEWYILTYFQTYLECTYQYVWYNRACALKAAEWGKKEICT